MDNLAYASVVVGILTSIFYIYTKNTSTVTSTSFVTESVKKELRIPESYEQTLEFYPNISDKTKESFQKCFDKISKNECIISCKKHSSVEKDIKEVIKAEKSIDDIKKDLKWYCVSIIKGWEGSGVILYLVENGKVVYVFGVSEGVNKETGDKFDQLEYSGGKPEMQDESKEATVRRKLKDETQLELPIESFQTYAEIHGGNTGYPYYAFLVEITPEQYASLKSTKTLREYVKVYELFDVEQGVDTQGKTRVFRNFNVKYVFPQIKDKFLEYRYQRLRALEASGDHGVNGQ